MLRHGIMPPKEIVRPESARIAIQGVQPKGLDEFENAITPVGKTIKSMFPFYLERTRLGGRKRKTPLTVEDLTNDDLEMVNLDVRANANRIYQDVFNEYSSVGDTNRGMQPEWVMDARESLQTQQRMVIQDLVAASHDPSRTGIRASSTLTGPRRRSSLRRRSSVPTPRPR